MKIPQSGRRKALILVDLQKGFVPDIDQAFVNTRKLIDHSNYELYITAAFHTEKGSLRDKQVERTFPESSPDHDNIILPYLQGVSPLVELTKTTKSCFKGSPDLDALLKKNEITEVHIVGYDIYDCVFATAQEAFDLGYFTYVIEECTSTFSGNTLREGMIAIMRELCMTNNSLVEKIDFQEIE